MSHELTQSLTHGLTRPHRGRAGAGRHGARLRRHRRRAGIVRGRPRAPPADGDHRADGRDGPVRAARSPRSTAGRAATTSPCASRSRRSPGSTSRSRSRSRRRSGLGAMPVFRHGTEEQKAGGCPTCSPAARSPASGSPRPRPDRMPAAPAPPRVLDGDEWVINGSKQFITNSGTPITRFVTVTAVTGERTGPTAASPRRSRRSSCRTARPASPSSPRTTRSAGTPPTRIR